MKINKKYAKRIKILVVAIIAVSLLAFIPLYIQGKAVTNPDVFSMVGQKAGQSTFIPYSVDIESSRNIKVLSETIETPYLESYFMKRDGPRISIESTDLGHVRITFNEDNIRIWSITGSERLRVTYNGYSSPMASIESMDTIVLPLTRDKKVDEKTIVYTSQGWPTRARYAYNGLDVQIIASKDSGTAATTAALSSSAGPAELKFQEFWAWTSEKVSKFNEFILN